MRLVVLSAAAMLIVATAAQAQPGPPPAPQPTVAPGTPAPAPSAPAAAPAAAPGAAKVTTAPADSTIGQILAKGMTMTLADMEFVFSFKPADGTFETGAFAGKYWVEGTKMCFDIPDIGYNACSEYATGKKSGDKFAVETASGPADVKIN